MKLPTLLLLMTAQVAVNAAPTSYKIVDKINVGGASHWGYGYLDRSAHKPFLYHENQAELVDTNTDKVIGTIDGVMVAHGVAIANDLGSCFITNGNQNMVELSGLWSLKGRSSF